jgi:hypothetical protein
MKPTISETIVRFHVTGTDWDRIERDIELKLAALPYETMTWTCDLSYRPLYETNDGSYTIWRVDVTATAEEQ